MDLNYGVGKAKRNAKVVEALLDISCKTAGVRHKLANSVNLCALKGHSSCHNKSDITRTENYNVLTGHITLHINKLLRHTCAVDACGTVTCDVERSLGSLTASHCENDCLCLDHKDTVLGVGSGYYLVGGDIENHGVELEGDLKLSYLLLVSPSVLRSGKLLAEAVETEAVMNALTENTAKRYVSFKDKYIADSALIRSHSRTHTCRSAADNYKFLSYHYLILLTLFCRIPLLTRRPPWLRFQTLRFSLLR